VKRYFLLTGALALTGAAMLGPRLDAAPARNRAPHRAVPAARDWTRNVVATPELGFRMGNPAARVKLVEYGSMTCPHCAHFSAEGDVALASYVRRGTVSYEFRNYVLNGIDVAATLLARCSGPNSFFPMTHRLYSTQSQWVGRITGLGDAEKQALRALPEAQRLPRLAQLGGLTQIAGSYGVTPARAARCLTDESGIGQINRIGEAAAALGVEGTPTFLLNGANIGTHTWATLEPILRESGG
jgi:protein-disulfide isomerase